MANPSHPGIDNVCLTATQVMSGFALGLIISGVALWFGIWGH